MTQRIQIPQNVVDTLMVANRHTCCICNEPRKHVEIHHIDGNASHNQIENLAVLCRDCHSLVTSDSGLGRRYSINEVKEYKRLWEEECSNTSEQSEGEEDNCVGEHFERCILQAHTHLSFDWDLTRDDEIVYGISAESPVTFAVMNQSHYDNYTTTSSIHGLHVEEDILDVESSFTVERDLTYLLVLINNNDYDCEVAIDISIWAP